MGPMKRLGPNPSRSRVPAGAGRTYRLVRRTSRRSQEGHAMKRALVAVLLLSVMSGAARAGDEDDGMLKFRGGIGVIPVSNVNASGVGTANVVLGVNPGGQPWVIRRLTAKVKEDGRIQVEGRGLLLAGGNGIATNGGQSVEARLFCGGVPHETGLVPLEADGDFHIDDMLSPAPPSPCESPALLIVNAKIADGGRWF